MSLHFKAFRALAEGLKEDNGLEQSLARDLMAEIGDTPETDGDGLVEVVGPDGVTYHLIFGTEEMRAAQQAFVDSHAHDDDESDSEIVTMAGYDPALHPRDKSGRFMATGVHKTPAKMKARKKAAAKPEPASKPAKAKAKASEAAPTPKPAKPKARASSGKLLPSLDALYNHPQLEALTHEEVKSRVASLVKATPVQQLKPAAAEFIGRSVAKSKKGEIEQVILSKIETKRGHLRDSKNRGTPPAAAPASAPPRAPKQSLDEHLMANYQQGLADSGGSQMVPLHGTYERYKAWKQSNGEEPSKAEFVNAIAEHYKKGRVILEPPERPQALSEEASSVMVPQAIGPPASRWAPIAPLAPAAKKTEPMRAVRD